MDLNVFDDCEVGQSIGGDSNCLKLVDCKVNGGSDVILA